MIEQARLRIHAKTAARRIGADSRKTERVLAETLRAMLRECEPHQQPKMVEDRPEPQHPSRTETLLRNALARQEHGDEPTGCRIQLPFSGNSPKYDAVRKAIAVGASEMFISQYLMARAMSYFFEEIALALCKGRPVCIPCFGLLTVSAFERPGRPIKPFVAFCASRPLALQAKYACTAERALEGKERLRRHRKSHNPSNRRERIHSRVSSAHAAFRKQITRQSEYMTNKRGA